MVKITMIMIDNNLHCMCSINNKYICTDIVTLSSKITVKHSLWMRLTISFVAFFSCKMFALWPG